MSKLKNGIEKDNYRTRTVFTCHLTWKLYDLSAMDIFTDGKKREKSEVQYIGKWNNTR